MDHVIYKYVIRVPYTGLGERIKTPKGAKILSVHEQHGDIAVWALVDRDQKIIEEKVILLLPTGYDLEDVNLYDNYVFIGTVLLKGGNFVLHAFRERGLHEYSFT